MKGRTNRIIGGQVLNHISDSISVGEGGSDPGIWGLVGVEVVGMSLRISGCSHSRAMPSFPSQLEWKIGLAWANTRGILNSPS